MFHYESASLVGIREGLFFFATLVCIYFVWRVHFACFLLHFFANWRRALETKDSFAHFVFAFFRIFVCKFKAPPWKVSKT